MVLAIALWWGIPTYRKSQADAMVRELCAKDGGIKVYEVVKLSPQEYRNFRITSKNLAKPNDEYYYIWNVHYIKRSRGDFDDLEIWRDHIRFFRRADSKLLGESIGYSRRGGDPPGPWHPSSFGCPKAISAEQEIFVENTR